MKAEKVIIGGNYWVKDDQGDLVAATWDGVSWVEVEKPSATDGEYSYTETIGDLSVKHCFKTKGELLEFSNSKSLIE